MNDYCAYSHKDVKAAPLGEGRLAGTRFAVKDVFGLAGHTNGAGNPDWLRTHGPASVTAPSLVKLLEEGAALDGMTHTDELMFSLNGQNAHYGTPVNPRAADRIPGGSSSGSAVAVAAGMADFALGTDTGGSVRIPSSYCGIYGIRPTHDLVTAEGVIPLASSFDTVGWMARDMKLMLEVGRALIGDVRRADADHSGGFSRIFLPREAWEAADPAAAEVLRTAWPELERLAGSLAWTDIAPEGLETWMRSFRIIQGLEIWKTHGEWISRENPSFGPGIAERFAWAGSLQKEDGLAPLALRDEIKMRLPDLLGIDGLLVLPTAPGPAPELTISGEANEERRSRTMQLSCIAGLAGLPQLTIPWGTVDGAPVGLSIIAGRHQDMRLLEWIHDAQARELLRGNEDVLKI
ncbi:amidase [Paenibacillus pinihumi]|uniref:amidase n=1 Tax=Paenibacillus pinihumi TaxID=669462 RepID=UPI0003F6B2AC|nr:amidase [Paenibacillus pinihumi]